MSTVIWRIGCMLLLVVLSVGCAQKPVYQTPVIPAFEAHGLKKKVSRIRYESLREAATTVGAQGGLAWRAEKINCMLKREARRLAATFNFNALLLKDNVLPPVLEEGRNTLKLSGTDAIRLSDRMYHIVLPPRFATVAPTWREYLWMTYKKPEFPDQSLLPKTPEERNIWNQYIKVGWKRGIRQANEIYDVNLARIRRDYQGMIMYRKLLAQNMVTAPYVSHANLGVTGGGNSMRLNDQVLRITAKSQLNAKSKTWRPVLFDKKKGKRVARVTGQVYK